MSLSNSSRRSLLNARVLCGYAVALSPSHAQTKAPAQVVNPPKTRLWMDVSTGGMAGMPELEIPGMGGLMGGKTGTHYYDAARTPHIMPPHILDVALWNCLPLIPVQRHHFVVQQRKRRLWHGHV